MLAQVMCNIFLVCVTTLLHRMMEEQAGVTIDFRRDGNLFNFRKLQATTKLTSEKVIELQYADDCALVAHTPEALQSTLSAAVTAYCRMGLMINTQKTDSLSVEFWHPMPSNNLYSRRATAAHSFHLQIPGEHNIRHLHNGE